MLGADDDAAVTMECVGEPCPLGGGPVLRLGEFFETGVSADTSATQR